MLLAAGACSTFTAEDSPSPDANANTSRETDAAPADAPADVPLDGGPEPISLISPYREGEGGLTYPLTIV